MPRFLFELGCLGLELCIQSRLFPRRELALPLELFQAHAGLRDLHLRILQFRGDAVAVRGAAVHALLQPADLISDFLEFALLDQRQTGILRRDRGHEGRQADDADQSDGGVASHRLRV